MAAAQVQQEPSADLLNNSADAIGSTNQLFQQVGFRPPLRMGGNIRAFQDPITLQEAFPGLRGAPGGAVLTLADNIFNLTGPASEAIDALDRAQVAHLINEIRSIDANYRLDSLGPITTHQGQVNQINGLLMDRAVALYRVKHVMEPLQVETLRLLQRTADAAYNDGLARLKAGTLPVRLSSREALGNYVDRMTRTALRYVYERGGIATGKGSKVRVNSREYDSYGSELTFRRPDARVGNLAYDVTITRKTMATQQVRAFFAIDFKPRMVLIIRPSQLGADSTYAIIRPGE